MKQFAGRVGRIHVLCNNAGVGGGDTQDPDFDAWDRALRINLGGVVNGVEGIRNNAPYILTHCEFRDEVRELCGMLDAAFPRDQDVPADRRAFEVRRREMGRQLRTLPARD